MRKLYREGFHVALNVTQVSDDLVEVGRIVGCHNVDGPLQVDDLVKVGNDTYRVTNIRVEAVPENA
jgi:ribosomal protein S28E/S33